MSGARFAVIDFETTGLRWRHHDRVVEAAVVGIDSHGTITDEFVSLINPGRDIGPTSIHGLVSADILDAPTFAEIAGVLLERLDGSHAIAAHNVFFDLGFLRAELSRLGIDPPRSPVVCTMRRSGGGCLAGCCEEYGVEPPAEAHSALDDARAAAVLLIRLMEEHGWPLEEAFDQLKPTSWPQVTKSTRLPVTRTEVRTRPPKNPYLERLVALTSENEGAVPEPEAMAYLALLKGVLEDRQISETEGLALVEAAQGWGLGFEQVEQIHHEFIRHLAVAALLDGIVTDVERKDLQAVARLLNYAESNLEAALDQAQRQLASAAVCVAKQGDLSGKSVCFTGELSGRLDGYPITREQAHLLAAAAGLTIATSVTKKLDLLVVADPNTPSGKAKKARQYGTRILAETVFWQMIGAAVH